MLCLSCLQQPCHAPQRVPPLVSRLWRSAGTSRTIGTGRRSSCWVPSKTAVGALEAGSTLIRADRVMRGTLRAATLASILIFSITRSMAAVLGSGPAPGMPMPPMQLGTVKIQCAGIWDYVVVALCALFHFPVFRGSGDVPPVLCIATDRAPAELLRCKVRTASCARTRRPRTSAKSGKRDSNCP